MTKRKKDNEKPTFLEQMENYSTENVNPDDPIFSKAYHTFIVNLLKTRDIALADELAEKVSNIVYGKLAETLAPIWLKLEIMSDDITAEKKRIEQIEEWQKRKKLRIEKIEEQIAILQPDEIKMISQEIKMIRPELEWFISAFKWWKIAIYVAVITGLWFAVHFFWLV